MNGSINSIIAWLTIRLDGQSAEALEHLDSIMSEMDRLENTLDQANERVESFTTDLDNLLKLVKDACSTIVYLDDNLVVQVTARKIQCAQGEAPFTRVCFEEIEELNASS